LTPVDAMQAPACAGPRITEPVLLKSIEPIVKMTAGLFFLEICLLAQKVVP
jgi:hypothetical protein